MNEQTIHSSVETNGRHKREGGSVEEAGDEEEVEGAEEEAC